METHFEKESNDLCMRVKRLSLLNDVLTLGPLSFSFSLSLSFLSFSALTWSWYTMIQWNVLWKYVREPSANKEGKGKKTKVAWSKEDRKDKKVGKRLKGKNFSSHTFRLHQLLFPSLFMSCLEWADVLQWGRVFLSFFPSSHFRLSHSALTLSEERVCWLSNSKWDK